MMLQIVSVVLTLQLLNSYSEAYTFDANGKASFCKDNDCPKFNTSFANLYEVRRYEASTWVESEISNMPFNTAKRAMFWKLFRYIQGQNANNQSIEMTVPALGKYKSPNSYTMMFYISKSIANPPQPTDPTVRINPLPAFTAYVRSFPGYPKTMAEWETQATVLKQSLNSDGRSFDNSYFVTAGYDAPWIQDRHNEVWLFPTA